MVPRTAHTFRRWGHRQLLLIGLPSWELLRFLDVLDPPTVRPHFLSSPRVEVLAAEALGPPFRALPQVVLRCRVRVHHSCFFFWGDRIRRQISTRANGDSVRLSRVKHHLAGDAKEVRKREKQEKNTKQLGCVEETIWIIQPIPSTFSLPERPASKCIMDGADAVGSFVMRSRKNSLEHSRATDSTTMAYISLRMWTLTLVLLVRSVVESAASFINKLAFFLILQWRWRFGGSSQRPECATQGRQWSVHCPPLSVLRSSFRNVAQYALHH